MTCGMPVSSARISCVLRAILAENGVGRASASSNELVCNDCVPPSTAASASIVVRMMLLCGSCSVRLTPEVWQCVRKREARRVLRLELLHQPRPQQPRGAQFGDLHEEIHADAEEERQARRELVDLEAARQGGADIFEPVGQA